MSLAIEIKKRAKKIVGPVLGCLLCSYFAYHAVEGDRGALAWKRLDQEIISAEEKLATLKTQNQALERKVARLRPGSIDPDLLEERARSVLNMMHSDDVVVTLVKYQ